MISQRTMLPISLAVAVASLAALVALMGRREVQLFPDSDLQNQLYHYCDVADGGNSRGSLTGGDSAILFAYILGDGFEYPYCGMGIPLQPNREGPEPRIRNLKRFDSLVVRYRTTSSQQLRLQITSHDPEFTRPEKPLSFRYLAQNIPAEKGWKTVRLRLDEFSTPEWWYQLNGLPPDPGRKFLDRAVNLEIQNGPNGVVGAPDTVEIAFVHVLGPNPALPWVAGGLLLFFVAGFSFLIYAQKERERLEAETRRLVKREETLAQYSKLPLESHKDQDATRLLEWVHSNYSDSELSLESATRATGINRNRLTALLRDQVGNTFKAYVNEIRLREAARALSETDLQVTEIAYKVGFGNVSHFNRVFKEKFGKTPVEYRKGGAN